MSDTLIHSAPPVGGDTFSLAAELHDQLQQRHGLEVGSDGRYTRTVDVLADIEWATASNEGQTFGAVIEQVTGANIDTLTDEQRLLALHGAADEQLQVSAQLAAFDIVPHTVDVVGDSNGNQALQYSAEAVQKRKATDQQKLAYLPGVIAYYDGALTDYLQVLEGTLPNRVFHKDLVKPGNYVYGATSQNPTEGLYMVDLDPEVDLIAEVDDEGYTTLSGNFLSVVIGLGVMSHKPGVSDKVRQDLQALYTRMQTEGVVDKDIRSFLDRAITHGIADTGETDPPEYRLPE